MHLLEPGLRHTEENGISSVVILVYTESNPVLIVKAFEKGVAHCVEDRVVHKALFVPPNPHDAIHRIVAVLRHGELRGGLVQ